MNKLRECLKKVPRIVRQGDITGTLWLDKNGCMRIKVFGEFDQTRLVHVVDSVGGFEFALKVNLILGVTAVKFYKVEWAISERGEILPDENLQEAFADGVVVRYPATALIGDLGDGLVDLGDGLNGVIKLIEEKRIDLGQKVTTSKWVDVKVAKKDKLGLLDIEEAIKVVDSINLVLSSAHCNPVVEKSVQIIWKGDSGNFVRDLEFGEAPIFKYTERFDTMANKFVMRCECEPRKMLAGILKKDLEPLKLWRGFTLNYNVDGGFLEDRMKYLMIIVDSIYSMRPEDPDVVNERAVEYDEIMEFLKEMAISKGKISINRLKRVIKSRKYYLAGEPDYKTKMQWLFSEAGISEGVRNVNFDQCLAISHKIRNNLSHHGTFKDTINELGDSFAEYYEWLIESVQITLQCWLVDLSNIW